MALVVKNLPANAGDKKDGDLIPELGRSPRGDPLEEITGVATHSGILACRIPWTEKPGGLQSMELQSTGPD